MVCGSNPICISDIKNLHDNHFCSDCLNNKKSTIDKEPEICKDCMKFMHCNYQIYPIIKLYT